MIRPKSFDNIHEEVKMRMQMLQLICSGPASQTLQESAKIGWIYVVEKCINNNDDGLDEESLKNDESAFFEYISREFEDLRDDFSRSEQYSDYLAIEYEHAFWNNLNAVIFGADAYRSFKQQKITCCTNWSSPLECL